MKINTKKIIIYITSLFLIFGGAFILFKERNYLVVPRAEKETLKAEITDNQPSEQSQVSSTEKTLPLTFKLEVPFTSQAPGIKPPWPEDFNNACEEAALIIVDAYINNKELNPENPKFVKEEILKMLKFQEDRYGERNKDLEAGEVKQLAKDYYDYKNIKVFYDEDVSIESIKREILAGHPVILPAAGRKLGNPHYSGEGPRYHMLVAIGWNDDDEKNDGKIGIITNDPGTKWGEGYTYKYDVLLSALHEWNRGDVENGRRTMIAIYD